MEDNERVAIVNIPNNFESGINILGTACQTSDVVQGVVLASIPLAIIFILLPALDVQIGTSTKFGIALATAGPLFYLGISGINGDSLVKFISNVIRFQNTRRTAYFNPRIKKEARSILNETVEEHEMLPRDKLLVFYKKYKNVVDSKEREKIIEEQKAVDEQGNNIYFSDDVGVIEKPTEYMDKKEYKKYISSLVKTDKKTGKKIVKIDNRSQRKKIKLS